jgi:branched-chain amino acid transport system ATP-binding protein
MSAPLLKTVDICLAFGGVIAADQIDFELAEGERLAVIGQNGAGKTTFLNICTGYLSATRGKVFFDGEDITGLPPRTITRKGIARSFQIPQIFTEHTVRECMQLAASAVQHRWNPLRPLCKSVNLDEVEHTLELVNLASRANDQACMLPEGQRKLLDVAMALVLNPRLLIMDEPTSGVCSDEKHGLMDTLMRALSERRVTSMFVEHDIDIVTRYATRLTAWVGGKIAADGPPAEVLKDPIVVKNVMGG